MDLESSMISIKMYKQGDDLVIGACDEELLGKRFSEGKFQIDVTKKFYDGERITIKTFERFLRDATIANLVGKQTVECAIRLGLVDPDCILKIKGVPHAQVVRMF
jgi:hypothetical protein